MTRNRLNRAGSEISALMLGQTMPAFSRGRGLGLGLAPLGALGLEQLRGHRRDTARFDVFTAHHPRLGY